MSEEDRDFLEVPEHIHGVDVDQERVGGRSLRTEHTRTAMRETAAHVHAYEEGVGRTEIAGGPSHPHYHQYPLRGLGQTSRSMTGPPLPLTKKEWEYHEKKLEEDMRNWANE